MSGARLKKILAALEENWHAEVEAYHTYLTLAERDTDAVRAQVLRHLAAAELEHAELWALRIADLGGARRRSITASPAARPIRWPTAPAASAWRCAGWKSKRAGTSPPMASS